jgi:branched-chain amino acid aminotransferase
MPEPIAWLDGRLVPLSEAKLSVFDLGVVLGASITEMIRTFGHRPFRLDEHLDRMFRSLRGVGFGTELNRDELQSAALRVVEHNAKLIPESHDLGIVMFVTAGKNLTYLGLAGLEESRTPSVCVHTFPLPFELWAEKMERGQHLVTPGIRHIPAESLDPKIKSRSRLHWYLADQQAKLADPHALALALDRDGHVTETSTGNFFIVAGRTICTPPPRTALGGVSQQVVHELADRLGIEYKTADLRVYDVLNADEAFTSSTPYCLMPVTRLNGQPIGAGVPGPVYGELLAAWSELAGVDIIEQIRSGAKERTT